MASRLEWDLTIVSQERKAGKLDSVIVQWGLEILNPLLLFSGEEAAHSRLSVYHSMLRISWVLFLKSVGQGATMIPLDSLK